MEILVSVLLGYWSNDGLGTMRLWLVANIGLASFISLILNMSDESKSWNSDNMANLINIYNNKDYNKFYLFLV